MSVVAYYDAFRERLIEDYQVRNGRVVAALEFAKDSLRDARTLLDVGCGIGWTSAEMSDTGKEVTGVDISPVLINTARRQFGDRCRFIHADFAFANLGRYDAVLMVDVYEHFARDLHPVIHGHLRATVGTWLALTMPTPATQQFARDHGIELQPVDEDITDDDVEQLAADLDATVIVNREVSVWRPGDYRHVLIERL